MQLDDDALDRIAARAQESVRLRVMGNAALEVNPRQLRRDAALAGRGSFPFPIFDDTARVFAEIRERQDQADTALRRAPNLAPSLSDPHEFGLIADDLESLIEVSRFARRNRPMSPERARQWQERHGVLRAAPSPQPTIANFFRGIWNRFVQGGEQTRAAGRQLMEDIFPDVSRIAYPVFDRNMRSLAQAQAQAEAGDPAFTSRTARGFYSGLASFAQMLPATAVSIALRNPAPAVTVAGIQSGLPAYGKYRLRGASPGVAALGGIGEGTVEAATELLPMSFLVEGFGRVGFGSFVAGTLGREVPGEQIATFTQDAIDTAIANPNKTWGEFLRDRPGAAYETFVASVTQAALVGGPSALIATRQRNGGDAVAMGNVDRVMDAAAGSAVRAESPAEFEAIVAQAAEGIAGENLYVPATAVRQLFQSAEDMAEDAFWAGYAEQVNEAEALGGDVVIPLAAAATNLAGTPQWDAIREQVRASPGGMSRAEMAEWEGSVEEAARQIGETAAATEQAARDAAGPLQRVFDDIRDKLTEAGFTTEAASNLATMFAQRQATRAQRLGRQLTGEEGATVVIRSDATAEGALQQSFMGGPRGSITLTAEGASIIDLTENRDLSTFIHESGHLFLEEMRADVAEALEADTDEGRQLSADWETLRDWFRREGHEIGDDGMIPTEAHELFARAFERFAMEGRAPSSALKRAFEAFRSWLLTIYKVVTNLRADLTDEIRDVMTRLLATDEEIALAAEEQEIRALFRTAEEAGMTEAEFTAYRKAAEEARGEAYDALLYRTMAPIRARRTKEWKEKEAAVRAEVAAEVDALPVMQALRLLRTGKIADEEARRVKLDRQWLIDTYGADAVNAMPKSVPPITSDKGTVHPDVIADELGLESGDELVRMLMAYEDARKGLREMGEKRSPRQMEIDARTDAAMAERYGDPLHDGSIEEEARALIHNDQQGEVMAAELRALARQRQPGSSPFAARATPYQVARRWAADKIASGKVAEVASGAALQQYQRAARLASKAAEEAMIKGDRDEAYRQKQKQMLNNALVAEGKKAKDRVDASVARLGRIARRRTSNTIAQDYLDQAHQLLEQVDFRTRSQRDIDKQQSFETWAAAQREAGVDIVVPDSFAASLGQTHWSRLSVEELIGLDDTVKQIIHLGRLKQTLKDGQERRAFEEVIAEMQAAGGGLKQRPPSALNDPDRNWLERSKSKLRGADAALIKIEQVVDWLDGGNSAGIFNRTIFKPLADAQGREADMLRAYVEKVNEAIDAMPREQLRDWRRRIDTPELINRIPGHPLEGEPWSFFKDQIVMIAMNLGNDGNRQRLLDGYGWSEAQVKAVLDRNMTADDWRFVQSIWDTVDTLWPDLEALEKRVNGFAPEKVEAVPVETPHGTFRGGYFPVVYDPHWSARTEQQEDANLLERGYVRANVRAASTKERAQQVKRPILLSMEVITRHLGEVIHDLSHREALTEVWRVVSEPRVERTISNALGPEYAALFRPWLKHIANDQARNANSNSAVVNLFRRLRMNVTIVGLGYRFLSTVAQIAGTPNIIAQIGAARMAEGYARFLANPVGAYREVTGKSAELRDRFSTMDRDIVERAQAMSKRQGIRAIAAPHWFARYAFHGILIMDAFLTTAGWIGAYRRATTEGMTEEEAIYFADKVVRKSQGAGGAKDQAAITREHEAVKVFTMFFSYFSALYSQQRDFAHRLRRVSSAGDLGRALHFGFWVVIAPPLLDALIRGEGPDEDDDEAYAEWAAKRVFFGNAASIPGVREVAGAIDKDFGYRASPIQNIGESLIQGWNNVERSIDSDPTTEASSRWLKQTLTLAGLLSGQPTGQIAATAQFGRDVQTGEADPQNAGDWWEGLTTGRVEAD